MNFIEKVYIINLDRRMDRMVHMDNLMKSMYIRNWERFKAIRPKTVDITYNLYSDYSKFHKLNRKYVKGSVGCKLSHIGVLKLARKKGYKNILILEDDVNFIGNRKFIDMGLREVHNLDWDILYLGLNKARYKPVADLVFIGKVESGMCTHSYIVNGKSYDKIINILEKSHKQIDAEYQDCMKDGRLKCYIIPRQFIQTNSMSDINGIRFNF